MSAPRMIIELVVTGFRVLGKATAAAGSQAVKNFKHKPDGAPSAGAVGTGSSKSQITNQMQMSLDEAHLILNVKKDDPIEVIEKSFERIFKSNAPAPEVDATTKPAPGQRQTPTARKSKAPTHSHYLQSKVYRALERIKAERDTGAPPPPPPTEGGGEAPTVTAAGPGPTGQAAPGAAPGSGPSSAP